MKRQMMGRAGFSQLIVILTVCAVALWPQRIGAQTAPHTGQQGRPIQLGTSGGNINDASALYCCSGTLGSLVQNSSGAQFVLSNNHVLANTNMAQLGDLIIQPGLIDQTPVCAQDAPDVVANLSAFQRIAFKGNKRNTIDAAIALVVPGAVDPGGAILEIGQVSSAIAVPTLGMGVKKSGRTTGLTTGSISAINVSAKVQYSKQCGVGSQTAQFVNQIVVTPGTFSAGGDSGSVVVENTSACPRAVGLLFAGSSTITLANPIANVLTAFGVNMVGCSSSASRDEGLLRRMTAWLLPSATAAQGPPVDPAAIAEATHVKEQHEQELLSHPGVVGIGIGLSETIPSHVVIEIYVEHDTPQIRQVLPSRLNSTPVKIVETGAITAFGDNCNQASPYAKEEVVRP